MAGGANVSSISSCKRCKREVVNDVIKCINCASSFHPSCAKLCSGVTVLADQTLMCCKAIKTLDTHHTNVDEKFWDAVDEIAKNHQMLDPRILCYILKQKDQMIFELREQISSLNTQIEFLQKNFSQSQRDNSDKNAKQEISTQMEDNEGRGHSTNLTVAKTKFKQTKNILDSDKSHKKTVENETAQNQMKQQEENEDTQQTSDKKVEEVKWTEARRKHRKTSNIAVVGTGSSNIETVPKKGHLFVSRLHPNTDRNSLEAEVKKFFHEGECEPVTSKHPNVYASFKVTINASNLESALKPEIWAPGALVTKFFHRKKKINDNS